MEGKNFPGGMLAVSGQFLAYLVNERKVRIFNTETGQKCSIDRAHGVIVGLAWSDNLGQPDETFLAVLAEDGEITIGKMSAEGFEEDSGLSFEVTSILSFPEIGRARAITWNQGSEEGGVKKHLAVHGNVSSDVFFVHAFNGKSSFANTSIQEIKNVSLTGSGACWVSGRDGCVEKFNYSGNSYHQTFSLKLPVKNVDSIKVIEHEDSIYCLVLSGSTFDIFLLNNYEEDQATLISSLDLESSFNELVYNLSTRTLLLFSHGNRNVQIVSLAKMSSPRLISHELNSKSSIVLDAVFNVKNCYQAGESVNYSILFYLADSICCQEGSFDLEIEESEYEEAIQTEAEADEFESEEQAEQVVTPFDGTQAQESDFLSASPSLDMSVLRAEIKLMVREAVKESLTEVIHDALNAGIRAGFSQISEDLMNLTRNLIKSVESVTGLSTVDNEEEVPKSDANAEIQSVRVLISQGQFGLALRKASAIGNSRLLLEVCQKFEDPFNALDEEQLPQETLMKMFGLLSLDIDEDTEVKLDWLQEILIQIDFDSGIIESSKLSEQVDGLFIELKSLVNDSLVDGNLQKKMKTVMRLLRKFQMN